MARAPWGNAGVILAAGVIVGACFTIGFLLLHQTSSPASAPASAVTPEETSRPAPAIVDPFVRLEPARLAAVPEQPLIPPVAPGNGAAAHPDADGDRFDAQVQEALGIKDTGADILTPLAVIWSKADKRAEPTHAELDAVVDALLRGPHPTVLQERLLPLLQVGVGFNFSNGAHWQWGSMDQWDQLERLLAKQAADMATTNPARAGELEKASFMLALICDYNMGWYALAPVENEPEETKKILALPDGQFEKLQKLVADRGKAGGRAGIVHALECVDAVSAAPAVSAENVQTALAAFDKALHNEARAGDQLEVIQFTWALLNLVKFRHSIEGQAAVEKQLRDWKTQFADPDVQRWIDQTLTREGPPPHQFVAHLNG